MCTQCIYIMKVKLHSLQASCLQEEETSLRVDELTSKEKTQRLELQRFKIESENLQLK